MASPKSKPSARNITDQYRWREKTKHLINLRICMTCKYPFISGKGTNTCYDCHFEFFNKYSRLKPNKPFFTINTANVRKMMVRANLAQPIWRATINPAIPIPPEVESDFIFKEAVRKTFTTYPYPCGRKILGWKSYPELQFTGFKTGRPQIKVRRLTLP